MSQKFNQGCVVLKLPIPEGFIGVIPVDDAHASIAQRLKIDTKSLRKADQRTIGDGLLKSQIFTFHYDKPQAQA